jgi:hypothetical protein
VKLLTVDTPVPSYFSNLSTYSLYPVIGKSVMGIFQDIVIVVSVEVTNVSSGGCGMAAAATNASGE